MSSIPLWLAQLGDERTLFAAGQLLIKVSLLFAAAWCAHLLARRANPRWSVLLWRASAVGTAILIAMALFPPTLRWAVLPAELPGQQSTQQSPVTSSGSVTDPSAGDVVHPNPTSEFTIPFGEASHRVDGTNQEEFDQRHFVTDSDARLISRSSPVAASNPFARDSIAPEVEAGGDSTRPGDNAAETAAAALLVWSAGLWFVGFAGCAAWMICGLRRVQAVLNRATTVPSWVDEQAVAVREQLGCRPEIEVRQSSDVATPCLMGLRRPVVLLPAKQCDRARRDELAAILAHETAHRMGRDLPWNMALHGLSMLFWFHPFAWRIRAAHARACDGVADAIAADYVGDVVGYGRTLARLAVQMHAPAPVAALAMARTSDVRQRIEALQRQLFRSQLPRRLMVSGLVLGTVCVVLLGSIGLTPVQGERPQKGAGIEKDSLGPPPQVGGTTADESRLLAQQTADQTNTPAKGADLYGDPLPSGAIARLGTVRYRHPGWHKHVEFLSGTSMFAVGTSDNAVRLWDARSGRKVREFDLNGDYLDAFRATADGKSIVTLSHSREFDQAERIYHMRLVVWDAASGKEVRPIKWDDPLLSSSTCLALSEDGKSAAVATRDGEVRIWDLPWGEERMRKKIVAGEAESVEFSPDGKTIVVASRRGVFLWEFQTDNEPRKLDGLQRGGQVARFSPDATILAVGSDDSKPARLFDAASGELLRVLNGKSASYHREGLCFTDDGDQLLVPAHQQMSVEIFNVSTGKLVRSLDAGGVEARDVALSSDGRLLASVGSNAAIAVWDLTTGELLSDQFVGHAEAAYDVAFTPDSGTVVSAGPDGTIRIWDASTGRQRRVLNHDRWVAGLAVSPDGQWVASCGLDDTVRLWESDTGRERYKFPGHGTTGGNGSTEVAFSADGTRFYSFGLDLYLRAYSVETGRILAEHAIRPSGMQIEETEEGELRLAGGGPFAGMGGLSMAIEQAILSPDATKLLIGHRSLNAIYVFDTDAGVETSVVKPTDRVLRFCISPRGDALATIEQLVDNNPAAQDPASRRYVLRLHDLSTQEVIREAHLEGSFGSDMAFSDDGSFLGVSQSTLNGKPDDEKWVDIRNVETFQKVARISGYPERTSVLSFSQDGKRLATSNGDSTVMVWDLDSLSVKDDMR